MNIIEFAQQIGVSPTTVSRALSGHGRISASTREMIQRKMVELGYAPNPHAQSLVTGRSRMILLHHSDRSILSDMFLVEMAHGIQQALEEEGYGLLLDTSHTMPGMEGSHMLNHWISSRAVDGVILKPLRPNREFVQAFTESGIPCIVIGDPSVAGLPNTGSVSIRLDNGIRQAAELFMKLGHRRIAYIGTMPPDPSLEMFREHLRLGGIDIPEEMVVMAGLVPEDGGRAMRRLLSLPNPPTAVFIRLDTLAVGAMHAANAMGVRIPEQLSIIGYGDIPLAGMWNPPLTTVHVGFFDLGRTAMETLFELINDPNLRVEAKFLDTYLIVRESVSTPRS